MLIIMINETYVRIYERCCTFTRQSFEYKYTVCVCVCVHVTHHSLNKCIYKIYHDLYYCNFK